MPRNGFDRIAHIYRWGEAFTFGSLLMQCRTAFLDELAQTNQVLILGDGDGRFTTKALQQHPQIHVTAVDQSLTMLQLLQKSATRMGAADRITPVHTNACDLRPTIPSDVVCTHFFLDCLTTEDVRTLAKRLSPVAATWIVSEFDIPQGIARRPAGLLIGFLYLVFRLLTGLRVQKLPRWRSAILEAGYIPSRKQSFLGGILTAEVWRRGTPLQASNQTMACREVSANAIP